jgi:hypothetical protein
VDPIADYMIGTLSTKNKREHQMFDKQVRHPLKKQESMVERRT